MKKKLLLLSLLTLTIGLCVRPLNSFAVTTEESEYIESLSSSSCDSEADDAFDCFEEENEGYNNECEDLAEDPTNPDSPCYSTDFFEDEDVTDEGEENEFEIVDDETAEFISVYEEDDDEEEEVDEESVKLNIIIILAVTVTSIIIIIALNLADKRK